MNRPPRRAAGPVGCGNRCRRRSHRCGNRVLSRVPDRVAQGDHSVSGKGLAIAGLQTDHATYRPGVDTSVDYRKYTANGFVLKTEESDDTVRSLHLDGRRPCRRDGFSV